MRMQQHLGCRDTSAEAVIGFELARGGRTCTRNRVDFARTTVHTRTTGALRRIQVGRRPGAERQHDVRGALRRWARHTYMPETRSGREAPVAIADGVRYCVGVGGVLHPGS
eukprot:6200347-Prymnesium_polylepis.1